MEDADEIPGISPELVLELIAIRDSPIRTSLALRDWQYAMDSEAQKLAQEHGRNAETTWPPPRLHRGRGQFLR